MKKKKLIKEITTTVQVNRQLLFRAMAIMNKPPENMDIFRRPYTQREVVHLALNQLIKSKE